MAQRSDTTTDAPSAPATDNGRPPSDDAPARRPRWPTHAQAWAVALAAALVAGTRPHDVVEIRVRERRITEMWSTYGELGLGC